MLSARELVVTLVIDEIYVTSRLDYKAQTVVGYAENESSKKDEDKDEFAKTKVAFMVCSASYGLAEKKIRIKHVFRVTKSSDLTLEDVRALFAQITDTDISESFKTNQSVLDNFNFILETDYLVKSDVDESSKIYVCGYATHTTSKKNGLSIASDPVNFIFVHMSSILQYIMCDSETEAQFLRSNPEKSLLCSLTERSVALDSFFNIFQGNCSKCEELLRAARIPTSTLEIGGIWGLWAFVIRQEEATLFEQVGLEEICEIYQHSKNIKES
nr:unnamed protein product [Callosobruchus analis]